MKIMKIGKVKAIVWDLDGTLIDSFGIFVKIIAEVCKERGHKIPPYEVILHNYHGSLEDSIQKILGLDSVEELAMVVDSFINKQGPLYVGNVDAHFFNDATVLAKKAAQKGILQLLITNRANNGRKEASPKEIIAASVIADCIHEVRSADEVSFRKPDKRSVWDWIEKHNITPDKVLVIGDQHVDAQLAMNVGARALLIQRNGEIPHLDNVTGKSAEIYVVDSLHEIELN